MSDIEVRKITISKTFLLTTNKILCMFLVKAGSKPIKNKKHTSYKGFSAQTMWYERTKHSNK